MPPYTSDNHDAWEEALLQEVKRTVKEVWAEAGRPPLVYLAVDGVVPMAKIRQQRVRRFKSAWLAGSSTEESYTQWDPSSRAGREHPDGFAIWDKNAITPGTEFMDVKLTRALQELCKEHKGWSVSPVSEEGEGEQKVMRWIRQRSLQNVVVYGLDADLILLSMITTAQTGTKISLLREKQEFGGPTMVDGVQEYQILVLEELVKRIGLPSNDLEGILNYVALMSLMGNDFLPHSLTHSLTDDGHECVLDALKSGRKVVVSTENLWKIDRSSLLDLIAGWSREEESRLVHMIKKKRQQAERGVGKGMEEREGLPLEWDVEAALLPPRENRLVNGWKDVVWSWIHPSGSVEEEKVALCEEYLFGCQWILDYYTGQQDIDLLWMFSAWLPPLWSDFAFVQKESVEPPQRPVSAPLRPSEQLAMVLPLDSWGLIRDRKMRRLPALCPQMWPQRFGFLSAGRKWLWQCEALVPVLTAERLRGFLEADQ